MNSEDFILTLSVAPPKLNLFENPTGLTWVKRIRGNPRAKIVEAKL